VCLPLVILPRTMKSKRSFLLVPAHPGGPRKGPQNVCGGGGTSVFVLFVYRITLNIMGGFLSNLWNR